MLMGGLILVLAGIVTAVVAFYPNGEAGALPDPLEAVFPLPGDVVVRQTTIEVDLPVGYEILDLVADGIPVPISQLAVTEATGDWRWRPQDDGGYDGWTAGDHTIYVRWDRVTGENPDPGEYVWTFRVG